MHSRPVPIPSIFKLRAMYAGPQPDPSWYKTRVAKEAS